MAKSKYEVVIPYFGVTLGQIVEIDGKPNDAFAANLRKLPEDAEVEEGEMTQSKQEPAKSGKNWKA